MQSPTKLYLVISRKAQIVINNPKLLSKKSDADAEAERRNTRSQHGAEDWRVEIYSREVVERTSRAGIGDDPVDPDTEPPPSSEA